MTQPNDPQKDNKRSTRGEARNKKEYPHNITRRSLNNIFIYVYTVIKL